jgi:hypothetical protein
MSNDSIQVYGIGDKVSVLLINNEELKEVKFSGIDNRGFFIFENSEVYSLTDFCVPESSIVFVAVKRQL